MLRISVLIYPFFLSLALSCFASLLLFFNIFCFFFVAATAAAQVRDMVGEDGHVIGAVSGGVDSSVAAVLMQRAIGDRFHAFLIDNGCLRLVCAAAGA